MSGWIKLHRQILEWEWYSDNNCFRLFTHLVLKANYKQKRFKGIELKIGSIVTSRDILARETGLSSQQIRTALNKLISTNEVTSVTSSQGTIIQIVNYEKYQVETNETTNEQPTDNQQVTTNKKVKKEKNNKEIILDAWIDYRKQIKKPIKDATIESILNKMKQYSDEQCKHVINNSIQNGYQGLFWDNVPQNNLEPEMDALAKHLYEHNAKFGGKIN